MDTAKQELVQRILGLQLQIQRSLRDDAPEPWLALNLSIAQLKCLFFIGFAGVTNFTRLAEALNVTAPNISGIIERLVEHGLVSRESNQTNRRMQMLKLTPAGADLVSGLKERTTAHFSRLLGSLSLEDLAALARGLKALSKAAAKDSNRASAFGGPLRVGGRAA
jgi:DNA-binding MarR family transcriptional regulator